MLLVSARAITGTSVSGVDYWKNMRIFPTLVRIRAYKIDPLLEARAAESH
jgi:hypothetical protein